MENGQDMVTDGGCSQERPEGDFARVGAGVVVGLSPAALTMAKRLS